MFARSCALDSSGLASVRLAIALDNLSSLANGLRVITLHNFSGCRRRVAEALAVIATSYGLNSSNLTKTLPATAPNEEP